MKATIYNADYFGFDPIDLDFPCEIHFTRFGNTQITLHNKYRTFEPRNEKINFNNPKAFKVFVCSTEPSTCSDRETNLNIIQNGHQYDLILTWEEEVINKCDNAVFFPYGGTWLNKNKNKHADSLGVFDESQILIPKKEYSLSFLSTSHLGKPGYNMRYNIWNNKDKIELNTKFYSSTRFLTNNNIFSNTLHDGLLPNDDKINLFKSMFSVTIESCYEKNYFTEKLIDCLLTKTVPIYWGCPNIGNFFDTRGIIMFETYEEFLEKVNSINEKTYQKMKKYVDINYEKAKEYGRDLFQRVKEEVITYRNSKLEKTDMLWTIGILTVPKRKHLLERLVNQIFEISPLSYAHRIELIIVSDEQTRSIGNKRNEILEKAKGKYISFIDDDDLVSPSYIHKICLKLDKGIYDGIGFRGLYYHNGVPSLLFLHSSINKNHKREEEKQYRPLNHLNPILTEYARQVKFSDISYGEDTEYADKLNELKLVKNEFMFDEVMYHYIWSNKETLAGKQK